MTFHFLSEVQNRASCSFLYVCGHTTDRSTRKQIHIKGGAGLPLVLPESPAEAEKCSVGSLEAAVFPQAEKRPPRLTRPISGSAAAAEVRFDLALPSQTP